MNIPPIPEEESTSQAQILFHEEDISFTLPDELNFIHWIRSVIEAQSCHLKQLNYIFCSICQLKRYVYGLANYLKYLAPQGEL